MTKWKLCRQTFGSETYSFSEGEEVSLGRGFNNTITLSSLVVSRTHCLIKFQRNQILITDLNSSNGIYVGTKRIPANIPYAIKESDVIGIGWAIDVPLGKIQDNEKFVFKVVKEPMSVIDRITFQDDELDIIEEKIASLEGTENTTKNDLFESKPFLKRKFLESNSLPRIIENNKIKNEPINMLDGDEIIQISDSDTENNFKQPETVLRKKPKLEPVSEEPHKETCMHNKNETNLNHKGLKLAIGNGDSRRDFIETNFNPKTPNCDQPNEFPQKENIQIKNEIKTDNEYLEFEAFNVKQEYSGYDEAIEIDSDSDSESEHWYLRLSQSSPGKPFMKMPEKMDNKPEDSSYSQMDDGLDCSAYLNNDNEYLDEAISIPPQPPDADNELSEAVAEILYESNQTAQNSSKAQIHEVDLIGNLSHSRSPPSSGKDEIDGYCTKEALHVTTTATTKVLEPPGGKKAQMIEPLYQVKRKIGLSTKAGLSTKTIQNIETKQPTKTSENESKATAKPESKSKRSSKHDKKTKHTSKSHITNSQKEERKRKLKEIAQKGKEEPEPVSSHQEDKSMKSVSHIKVTSSTRQAFLTDELIGKPIKRKESPPKTKTDKTKKGSASPEDKNKSMDKTNDVEHRTKLEEKSKKDKTKKQSVSPKEVQENKSTEQMNDVEHSTKLQEKSNKKESKHSNNKTIHSPKDPKCNGISKSSKSDSKTSLKILKPSIENVNSKTQDLIEKKKKRTVRFSEAPPEVHYFTIEDGNKMKKTSLAQTNLGVTRQMPCLSLERTTLMKILRWNPHWLEEQINNNDPPPILGHSNPPLAVFQSFSNHNQYVQLIGDLLLMEIWECLTIAYMKLRNQDVGIRMVIASLPPAPTQERIFDTFNISVDVSMPTSETRNMPRVGEILLVTFGPESVRHQRFFFVHHIRCLPSPQSNRNSFYNITLQATYSEKMQLLKQGEPMIAIRLAYINKELSLFESMAYMAGSPLSEAILRPEPRHFMRRHHPGVNITNPWTITLNPSQYAAVESSVSAAMGDRPCIQMVQGPPGTGKSSVICSIVMSYFYDEHRSKQQNRGKILICATSNAAVDELVIRLLNIRQTLPNDDRFGMVRVGRAEAMHPRARDVSSQVLAQREAARLAKEPQHRHGLNQEIKFEISRLEAKINMWKAAVQDAAAKCDPSRIAYCEGRINEIAKRIALLRSGGGGGGEELRPDQLAAVERRYIERADIVVTTLASALSHKMRGLKRRIALCIVDEAGQAIEPETLIPLTLDVTRLTLIGDPQQLPGYICSQRAKKHGLGESLFSRLASCAEAWAAGVGDGEAAVTLLSEQYRMHADIADYPNRAFYAGRVTSAPRARPPMPLPPYCIVGISSGDKGQHASGANETEAWGVSRLVAALGAGLRARGLSLAVITPYNAQKELIKKCLRALLEPSEAQVEVNTVDSFQGQERDVVVVSLARSSGVGFLTDAGRMNVMLTRARHALAVCLNPHAVQKNHQWRTLLQDSQKRKMYKTLPHAMCQAISLAPNDEILRYIS